MNKKLICLILSIISIFELTAQNKNVGIGTVNPDQSAILELKSTDQGFLIVRTDTSLVISPATGLLIYQLSDNTFYFFDGNIWKPLGFTTAGPTGPTGPTGSIGSQGNTGPAGPAGNAGATGSQGLQGSTGPTGADGITGPTGTFSSSVSLDSIFASFAQFDSLFASYAYVDSLFVNYASIDSLFANYAYVDSLFASYGYFDSLYAAWASFDSLFVGGTEIHDLIDSMINAAGVIGPTGPTGLQGMDGATGATGVDGIAGPSGADGSPGPTGPSGSDGAPGPSGPSGADGATGPSGADGTNGSTGPTGTGGSTGPAGPSGADGATGPSGANGANGATGPTGAAGPTGTTGVDGSTGPAGASGPTGPAGPSGSAGATGPTGSTGITGPTGPLVNGTIGQTLRHDGTTWVANSVIYNDGLNVGIGNTSPSYKLHVNGRLKTDGTDETSDIRFKEKISTIDNASAKIKALRGVYFYWKLSQYPERNFESSRQIGLIAQETEKIIPEVVHTDNEGFKSIEYAKLVALLIEAVNELEAEKAALEIKMQLLEQNNTELSKQLNEINSSIEKLFSLIQKEEAKK